MNTTYDSARSQMAMYSNTATGRQPASELYTTAGALLVNQQVGACAVSEDWLTSVRGLASYTVPRIDVLVSSTFRSTPGVAPGTTTVASNGNSVFANYNVSSAILQAQTGRPLVAGLPFQTVNLLPLGHDGLQQQHRDGIQPDVRPGDERRQVAAADRRAESALCALQRDVRLLRF